MSPEVRPCACRLKRNGRIVEASLSTTSPWEQAHKMSLFTRFGDLPPDLSGYAKPLCLPALVLWTNVLYLVMGHPLVMGHYFHFVKSNKTYNNSLTIHLEKLIIE